MPKYPSKPRRPLVSNLSTALLAWLLGAAPAAVAAQDSNIVPWRDHHAAFANGRDVFFLGGRKRAEGPAYTIPGNAADPNRSEWEADPSIFLLHANTTTSTLPAALPPLFGHSCATSDDGRFAYCTGGFRPNLPPYFGERNLYIFDLARRTVDQREMNVPLSGATWLPATRGLHATIFVDDELYLIGGMQCLFCSQTYIYGAQETLRYNVASGGSSFIQVVGASQPSGLGGVCATKLLDGRVLLIGGSDTLTSRTLSDQVWIFDPKSVQNTFTPIVNITGTQPQARWGAVCGRARSQNVVFVQGGCNPNTGELADGAIYALDVDKREWKVADNMNGPGPRCFAAGTTIHDYLVVHGGRRPKLTVMQSTPTSSPPPPIPSTTTTATTTTSGPPKPTPTGSTGNGGDGTGAEDGGSQHPNPSDPGSSSERPPWWPDEIPFPPADNARRIRGRDIVLSPSTEAADDAGVYAFDTTSGAWVAPKDLSKPFRESTGPTPEPPVHENAPNRTGTIIGAILGSIALVAAVALSGWYVKRHRARKRYENLAHEARASGSARAFKLRPNVDDATDYNPSVINSHRNVVVPLLAPIPPDEGSRAAWRASQKAERAPSLSSLHLGLNFAHITLDRGSTSSDVGALPLRGESIFRRRTHSDHGQAEVAPRAEPEPELADITSLLHSQQPPAMAEVGYDLYKPTAAPPPPTPANLHSEAGMTDPNGNLLLTSQGYTLPEELMYMVVYPHLPRLSDEVELHPGDEVAVRKIYQDGWCRGTNLTTGYSGVFPLLAVEDVDPAAPAVESGLDYFDSYYGLHGNMDSVDKSSSSLGLNSLLLGANDPGYGADVQPRGPERVNTDDTIMAERIYENAANPADQKTDVKFPQATDKQMLEL